MINIPYLKPGLLYYEDIVPLIPAMTDYSSPYGLVTCSTDTTTNHQYTLPYGAAWEAFDGVGDASSIWGSDNPSSMNEWIQYAFPFRMRINQMSFNQMASNGPDFTILFQATNDESLLTWTTILSLNSVSSGIYPDAPYVFPFIDAKYWRWYCTGASGIPLNMINGQLYGYK